MVKNNHFSFEHPVRVSSPSDGCSLTMDGAKMYSRSGCFLVCAKAFVHNCMEYKYMYLQCIRI